MLLLRPAEVEKLVRIVRLHHAAFLVEAFGPEAAGLDRASLRELVRLGLVGEEEAAGKGADPVGDAWLAGRVLARLRDLQDQADAVGEGLTYDQVEEELRRDPVTLGPVERRALQAARNSAGQYCRGLGNTVDEDLRAVAIEADDAQADWFREHIEEATAEAIARRFTVDHLRSELGHRTGDWARDLERIAATELKNAHSEGVATYLEEEHGDQALVAKIPNPGACPSCLEAYTTDGATPRVFTLAALRANGSNVGRKARERKPVVESHHPHCDCELVHVPDGYTFVGRRLVRRHVPGVAGGDGAGPAEEIVEKGRGRDARRRQQKAERRKLATDWAPAPHSRIGAYRRRGPDGKWEYRTSPPAGGSSVGGDRDGAEVEMPRPSLAELEDDAFSVAVDKLRRLVRSATMARFLREPRGEMPVLRIPRSLAQAIGSKHAVAALSADTAKKNLKHHPDLRPGDYARLPELGASPDLVIQDSDRTVVLIKNDGLRFMAAVRATPEGRGLYLTSFRRVNERRCQTLASRGKVIAGSLNSLK